MSTPGSTGSGPGRQHQSPTRDDNGRAPLSPATRGRIDPPGRCSIRSRDRAERSDDLMDPAALTRSSRSTYWPRWREPRKRSRGAPRPALGRVRVLQQGAHPLTEGTEVARRDEAARAAVLDLVRTADPRRRHRASFPHRLRDRQPETLGKALLSDHVCAALERVDDYKGGDCWVAFGCACAGER